MNASRWTAAFLVVVSAALLSGAYAFQIFGGLAPCEMCWWQRYAHMAVLALGALALLGGRRLLTGATIAAMWVSAGLGLYHAGVEQKWWQGVTECTAPVGRGLSTADMMDALLKAPLVRCDSIPWSLFGISMAGWNALLSAAAAVLAIVLLRRLSGRKASY